jgi:hypothetical protein
MSTPDHDALQDVWQRFRATMAQQPFPSRQRLWRGVVLSTIANALWAAADSRNTAYQWWDRSNYIYDTQSGGRVCIHFGPTRLVGALYEHESRRSPFGEGFVPFTGERYDPMAFFAGAPAEVIATAREQPLQYLLDDIDGVVQPWVTAAFWSEGDMLTAAEPWPNVLKHGGDMLHEHLLEPHEAYLEFQDGYEFTDEQIALVQSVFERRMAARSLPLHLTDADRRIFTAEGTGGLEESRRSLAAVGILL